MSDEVSKFQQNRFVRALFRPFSSGAASILIILASGISYVAGLLRDVLLGNYFGASGLTDMYNSSFLVPDMIYTLTTAGALSGIFLPVFRSIEMKDKKEAQELAGSFLILSQILVLIISALAFVFMPKLLNAVLNEADPDQIVTITQMSRIMLLSPILFSLSNTFGSILITFKHYMAYAFSAAFYNVGILIGLIFFHDQFGIMSGVIGVIIGLGLHLLLRLVDFGNLKFKIKLKVWSPGIFKIVKLAVPKTLSLLLWQSTLWIYNAIGYALPIAGSISAFYYARNIQSFAVSIFGIAIASSVFPFIVDLKEEGKKKELVSKLQSSFLQILIFTVPAAIGLALLDTEVIRVLLQRGEFDATDTALTAGVLFFFAFSIPFESLMHLLSRTYYAFHNTIIPVLVNVLFFVINVGGSYWLAQEYGVKMFGILFSIGSVVQILLLSLFLRRFVKLQWGFLFVRVFKILLATLIMIPVVIVIRDYLPLPVYISLFVAVGAGFFTYLLVLRPLNMIRYTGLNRLMLSLKRFIKK